MKKGSALITVTVITFLLIALVGSLLAMATNSLRNNERYYENLAALSLAEAGADLAIWELNYGGSDFAVGDGWSGGNPVQKTMIDFQDSGGTVYGDIYITVYDPGLSTAKVLSKGVLTTGTGPQVSREIWVELKKHKIFNYAILAQSEIDVAGTANKIDSYNSSIGPYGGSNVGSSGDIVTNSTADPAIYLRGGATVDGDAATGPDGSVLFEGGGTLSGTVYDSAEEFIPAVVVPSNLTSLTSLGDLLVTGHQSAELLTGNYKYDSMTVDAFATLTLNALTGPVNLYLTENPSVLTSGQSQIIVQNGQCNIYFDGNVALGGQGILNEDQIPSDLMFYGTDSVTNIDMGGIGAVYGCFYAPDADFFYIAGNSEVYGAVVGSNIELTGNGTIHYDEALSDSSPELGYDPYAWQEK